MAEGAARDARDELARTRAHLAALVDCTDDYILICDERGLPVLFNRAYARLMQEVLGIEMRPGLQPHTLLPDPEQVAWWEQLHGRVLAGETFRVDYSIRVGDELRHYELAYTPILNHGSVAGFTEVARDITARRRAEEERRAIELSMLRAQKLESLGLLAGGIAHDFNNLLTAVEGNAALAADALPPDSAAVGYLARVGEAAERAAALCAQMLAYAGKGHFVVGPVDLSQVVDEIARMLEVTVPKHVALRRELGSGLPAVQGDATQLGQVVLNLITNAAEAIGDAPGTLVLRTGVAEHAANALRREYLPEDQPAGRYVHVAVEDDGSGMDEAARGRLFDPFFTSKQTGRGLGLSAVLGVVRAHGGAIDVRSELGSGTKVTVYLPALEGVAPRPFRSPPPAVEAWRGEGLALLVDDDRAVRRVTEHMLRKMGLSVLLASDGQEAVEVFRARGRELALVMVDVAMPNMDGSECCKEFQRLRPEIPIIVFSGYAEEEAMRRFSGMNVAGFLHKPFRPATLRAVVKAALETD